MKKNLKNLFLVFICAITTVFFGCSEEPEDELQNGFGVIITLPESIERKLFYDPVEIHHYDIHCFPYSYYDAKPGESIKIDFTETGYHEYIIQVNTYSEDRFIGRGEFSVSFIEGDGYKEVLVNTDNINFFEKSAYFCPRYQWEEKEGYYTSEHVTKYEFRIYKDDIDVTAYGVTTVSGDVYYNLSDNDHGPYRFDVVAVYTDEHSLSSETGKGSTIFSFEPGDKLYKDIIVNIEPKVKPVDLYTTFLWEDQGYGYTDADAMHYDFDVYKNGNSVRTAQFYDISTEDIRKYFSHLSWGSSYKIKARAWNNNKVIGRGEAEFTLDKSEDYKDIVVTMQSEEKPIEVRATLLWDEEKEYFYKETDVEKYQAIIYENNEIKKNLYFNTIDSIGIIEFPHISSTYTVKLTALKSNQELGKGEKIITINEDDSIIEETINIASKIKKGYFQFGEWPQTRVNSKDIDKESLVKTGKTYGKVYEVTDNGYEFIDRDGNKYVYRGDYYKVEPMIWYILKENGNSKTLYPVKIYDSISYYEGGLRELGGNVIYPNNYYYSNVRAYLNSTENAFARASGTGSFYDTDWTDLGFLTSAFSEEERKKIRSVNVNNSTSTTSVYSYSKYTCQDCSDYVYLLSFKDYAEASGDFKHLLENIRSTDYENNTFMWWSRSPWCSAGYFTSSFAGYLASYFSSEIIKAPKNIDLVHQEVKYKIGISPVITVIAQ